MNPSTALATVLVDELVRGGVREAVLCPGSRSAPLAYALQEADRQGRLRLHVRVDERSAGFLALGLAKLTGDPGAGGHDVGHGRRQPAPGRPGGRATPGCRCWCSAPTGRRSCGAPAPTRRPTRPASSVRRSGGRTSSRRPARRAGPERLVALGRRPGLCRGAGGPDRRRRARCTSTCRCASPLVPTPGHRPGSRCGRTTCRAGRTGSPGCRCRRRRRPPQVPASTATPRTLVVVGDLPRAGMAAEAVELARAAGWPVVAEPFGRYDRTAVVPHGPAAARRARLAGGAPARAGARRRTGHAGADGRRGAAPPRTCGSRWSRPPPTGSTRPTSRPASCRGARSPRAARPSTAAATRPGPATWTEAGRRVAKAVAEVVGRRLAVRPGRGRRGSRRRCPPGRRCSSARPTRCATSTWPSAPAALDAADAGGGEPGAGRHRRLRVHRGRHRPRRTGQRRRTR